MRTAKNIGKHELLGLDTEVLNAMDAGQIGISGKIVDESRNTLTVLSGTDRKILQKKGLRLALELPDDSIELDCSGLIFRPEDRTKRVI